ncbi:WxL domain-containing protein [Enterococcus faecalis]|uniref:WxL domain-containing protein n=1 Tax=Enterococcus faecalis TaxID=1351 RepID=UPI003CC50927
MKQTKWQRLATIGLCSSLVINAFSGVTAVAETITIESSPTVASSAKEATSASSATPESTESSQETTETSREEVTQETEKPEVVKEETQTEAKKQEEETVTSEVVQPNPVLAPTPVSGIGVRAGNLDSFYQLTKTQMLNYSWSTTKVFSVPALKMVFDIKGSGNELVNTNDFKLTAEIRRAIFYNGTGQYSKVISDSTPIITKESGNITIDIPAIELPLEGRTRNYYYLNNINFETPKYIKNIEIKGNLLSFKNQGTTGAFGEIPSDTTIIVTKESENLYSINSAREVYYTGSVWTLGKIPVIFFASTGPDAVYKQFLEFPSENPTVNVDFKKVTESFKDTAGATIPAPTGFTQGKQTSITSNNYTFKQAGTLPETYKASNGKTYKFKGWYKGKTKPNTLPTTKAPSYAVTYDDNDDLNVVYEEATEFPEATFQLGFVNQDGNLVKPDDIVISYDYVGYTGRRGVTSSFVYNTIAPNQKAGTSGNLKNVVLPKDTVPLPQKVGDLNGNTAINFAISLPKYYTGLSIYDKTGKINSKYPLPPSHFYKNNVEINGLLSDSTFVIWLAVDKATNGSYVRSESLTTNVFMDSSFPRMRRNSTYIQGVENTYYSFDAPVYYHLTQRKVTESFKDTAGATIPAPTGFTQGKQTSITSNNYTFKQAGTLPETYKASNGKTYKFKGWYKGKTKPNTLTTTKAPSYAVTYDDNDDLNVVYEEIEAFDFPALTYQFGFVGEDGKLANPADINITYDYKTSAYRGTGGGADDTVSFGTIATNQSATTVGNLKNVTMPATSIARPTETGYNGDAYANFSIKLPRYYQSLNIYDKTGKINPSYPLPAYTRKYSVRYDDQILPEASVIAFLRLTQKPDQSYAPYESYSVVDPSVKYPEFLQRVIYSTDMVSGYAKYTTFSSPVYYHLTNRKVTENFVDANGTKITPPTGFTQGKQTVINSDPYTFKQSGTLPDTYTTGGKTYKFKGWYKGKTKPNTLTTTKAPSYAVTYDDNDDLNVVYEEIEAFDFPALTYQFGFVDESGKRVDASTIDLTYDNWHGELLSSVDGWKTTSIEKGQVALTKNNLKEIIYPSHSLEIMNGRSSQYSAANLTFKIPKYYENISVYNKNGTFDTAYPFPTIKVNTSTTPLSNRPQLFQLKKSNNQSFIFNQTTAAAPADVQVPYNLREIVYDPAASVDKGLYHMLDKPIYYYLTNRKVTENFVDTNGTKITPPTGFTQGNQIPMTSNTFKYTAARALPASYTTGGKTYIFQGWYKGKTKPNTLTTSTTPTYNTTFDGNDDMTAIYKEEVPKASVALTRTTAETVTSGGNVTWRTTITNTSQAPLTTATIKKSTAWTTGLAAPTAMIVTPAGGTAKTVPVTATTWTNGVSLGTDIPVGKSATVQFTTKATGTAGQVLRAGVTTSGNYSGVSTSATVRVKDNDQAIVTPTAEGFISVPTFNFGQVGVAGSTQQHGLKKAADYYGNGTRNPYLRIKKTQPNWSLTAQLSQPKSATDSLPTATRLLLGAAPVSSFSNYNQPTELKNAVGTTSAISLNANNTATRIIANQQFTGSNIYQLDFTFNNVKLEVPANQGVKGQQYQAAITWNLVTGP